MLTSVPLLVVSFILFNLGLAGLFGDGPTAIPGRRSCFPSDDVGWRLLDDIRHIDDRRRAPVFLHRDRQSTRTSNASVIDHLLSTFVFVAFLVEFLLEGAAHPFFSS